MSYTHLQYFHAVATRGSIARAAQEWHVTAQAAEYGLEPVGVIAPIAEQFHAVTVERQLDHPAVKRILQRAGEVFAAA